VKHIVFVTIALTSLVGSHAIAADLPQAYQPAPVVVAPPPSWTGFYIGANVGGAWQQVSATPVSVINGVFINSATTNFNGAGVLAGGQAGFNYQVSNFLVGLEGDFSWTNAKATITSFGTGVFAGAVGTGTAQTDWYATLGPRLGFVFNDLLFYGKGGAA
jgi:outer membrane immunogenic protein